MNILSIDPGGTTGIAMRVDTIESRGRPASSAGGVIRTTILKTLNELASLIGDTMRWEAVVCEQFATSDRISKYGLYTVELVGCVRAMCYDRGYRLYIHNPQDRISWLEDADELLKLTHKKHVIHEKDALSHLLAFEDGVDEPGKGESIALLKGKIIPDGAGVVGRVGAGGTIKARVQTSHRRGSVSRSR